MRVIVSPAMIFSILSLEKIRNNEVSNTIDIGSATALDIIYDGKYQRVKIVGKNLLTVRIFVVNEHTKQLDFTDAHKLNSVTIIYDDKIGYGHVYGACVVDSHILIDTIKINN